MILVTATSHRYDPGSERNRRKRPDAKPTMLILPEVPSIPPRSNMRDGRHSGATLTRTFRPSSPELNRRTASSNRLEDEVACLPESFRCSARCLENGTASSSSRIKFAQLPQFPAETLRVQTCRRRHSVQKGQPNASNPPGSD